MEKETIMLDMLSDIILRLGKADKDELRHFYVTEIQAPKWTDEERQFLTNAFDKRAIELNRAEIGMTHPRWA